MKKVCAILGASDPEMAAIAKMLTVAEIPFMYGTYNYKRANSSSAYDLDCPNQFLYENECEEVWMIECDAQEIFLEEECVIMIDHHKEGDAGYGKPPEMYWSGSSIGQVWERLSAILPIEKLEEIHKECWDREVVAAADHCLLAAYAGLCPGISSTEIRMWRAISKSTFIGCSVQSIFSAQDMAVSIIGSMPVIDIAGKKVVDATGYDGIIPELPDACGIARISCLSKVGKKLGIFSLHPEVIEAWMEGEKAAGRIVWGAPARGYAGSLPLSGNSV